MPSRTQWDAYCLHIIILRCSQPHTSWCVYVRACMCVPFHTHAEVPKLVAFFDSRSTHAHTPAHAQYKIVFGRKRARQSRQPHRTKTMTTPFYAPADQFAQIYKYVCAVSVCQAHTYALTHARFVRKLATNNISYKNITAFAPPASQPAARAYTKIARKSTRACVSYAVMQHVHTHSSRRVYCIYIYIYI